MSILPFLVKAVDHIGMLWGSTPPNVILYFLGAFLQPEIELQWGVLESMERPVNLAILPVVKVGCRGGDVAAQKALAVVEAAYVAGCGVASCLLPTANFATRSWRRLLFMFLLIAFLPEWCGLPMGLERQPVRIGIAKWQKSEQGKYKLNVDSSIRLDSNLMGMGWILHDHHGHLVVANSTVREGAMQPRELKRKLLMFAKL
nr:uncharacterized protein LOC109159918 [Ipomoea trifida]